LVRCARSQKIIAPGERWELDHAPGKQGYLGPSHFHCNRQAGGKLGAAITNGAKRRRVSTTGLKVSRVW
jgi:hypothetical protein